MYHFKMDRQPVVTSYGLNDHYVELLEKYPSNYIWIPIWAFNKPIYNLEQIRQPIRDSYKEIAISCPLLLEEKRKKRKKKKKNNIEIVNNK